MLSYGRKNPLPFPYFEAVADLWSAPDSENKGRVKRGRNRAPLLPAGRGRRPRSYTRFQATNATPAEINSVTQNACQTPFAPIILHSTTVIGRMTTVYRHNEITSDAVPFPSPSSAPDAATETAETRNPTQR